MLVHDNPSFTGEIRCHESYDTMWAGHVLHEQFQYILAAIISYIFRRPGSVTFQGYIYQWHTMNILFEMVKYHHKQFFTQNVCFVKNNCLKCSNIHVCSLLPNQLATIHSKIFLNYMWHYWYVLKLSYVLAMCHILNANIHTSYYENTNIYFLINYQISKLKVWLVIFVMMSANFASQLKCASEYIHQNRSLSGPGLPNSLTHDFGNAQHLIQFLSDSLIMVGNA